MSKKAKLYLLTLINLIAWGYVCYRIYGALQGDDDIVFEESALPIKKIDEQKKEDSVVLILNYADPFLKGGNYSKEIKPKSSGASANTNASSPKSSPTVVQPKKAEVAPVSLDIKYIGLVKNNDKGTQTAMISINGKSYFVKPKDVVEGILIQEISQSQLKIKSGKNSLIISK